MESHIRSNQLLNFCQNARMAFLGRNTPTPLLSEFMAQVDDTIVYAVCRHGTGGGHVDWSPHLRKFANMKIQVPHFRGGFGITPNEGSAISAFYSATCALVVWLGSHGGNRPAQDFANTWAPGLNLTSPDSWHAPLVQALTATAPRAGTVHECVRARAGEQQHTFPDPASTQLFCGCILLSSFPVVRTCLEVNTGRAQKRRSHAQGSCFITLEM